MICVLAAGAYLFTVEEESKEKQVMNLKKETDILREVEELQKLNTEEESKTLSAKEKASRVAFLKGFRDYRKGYFQRSLKMFQHCLILYKKASLCQSYSSKAQRQIDKLIQKKIRLGRTYRENQQYEACAAAFKSVEIKIQDSKNLIYKEAMENRKLCEAQLKNKI